ncbi:DsbE family thiol:disulfide interchange protein [Scandinavium manionii]|uniref:DsbE family thiol:disulfide interchange protein n=1 Tax=Scandinavium manionii TaxID=2926520 RepID=UPI00135CCFDC|nr:DsbE family thiol:disulfide interchange protein [Scandinavium manionii]MCS2164223.1 DsbE family thiol:disulfide interchange protein [Scandinavium manionii]
MKHNFFCIPFVLFLGIITLFGWQLLKNSQGDNPSQLESALTGKQMPKLQIGMLDENINQITLTQLTNGRPWLINFWATWCPTCLAEHHYLNTLAKHGVRIVGINYKDKREKARAWLHSRGSPYVLNLYDPTGSAGFDFGVYGAPETFLIDGKGIIRYRHVGNLTPEVWLREIAPLWKNYQEEGAQ